MTWSVNNDNFNVVCGEYDKDYWVQRDLNPGPNDSDASSLWTELYKRLLYI